MGEKIGAVLVAGGGVAGIQAALDLAEAGFKVYLVESAPAIGGVMAQLDKTFPTNDCSICILSPKLVECGRHRNIEVISYAEILDVWGEPGNFTVEVRKKPRYVDEAKCTGCGTCEEKCPWKAPSIFDEGIGERKAIYRLFPQAFPNVPVIDPEYCAYFLRGKCRACERFCPTKAIDFEQKEEILELQVGAVILAPGIAKYDPKELFELGFGRFPNVVTSIQFERILSASGPFRGELLRPSDHKHPKRIAWLQCVGSRDESLGRGFCSAVCCTYAIKEAIVAKEHAGEDLETVIFYMDMRTFGKGFERYRERAEEEYGVKFVRARVFGVEEVDGTGNLRVRYADEEGRVRFEDFDMVVLSVGLEPPRGARELARRAGVKLDKYGFCWTSELSPIETTRPGVFVCGAFEGPKDIPESVTQASGAAALASSLLAEARNTLTAVKEYPPERDVSEEPPRIGVFVCHCGINIAGVVDVAAVRDYAATLPDVVYAETNIYSCSQDTQQRIKEKIREHKLNRVVVAACTPRTHEPLFRETLKEAGLNPYLFEMANIRDQCSWVHMREPEKATEKAKDLIRMAVAKARLLKPLRQLSLEVIPRALVIGGGIAGMTAALNLAEQGFEVDLVEKEGELGGLARKIGRTFRGEDMRGFVRDLAEKVLSHPKIKVHLESKILDASGYVGNFTTKISERGEEREIRHGAVIVAIGGREYKPFGEYLYGEEPQVLTQLELEEALERRDPKIERARHIVFIQCVGSRDERRPYCSRVCCNGAVERALRIKEINPGARIFVLHRDMRTYGLYEELYRKAREEGVVFLRWDVPQRPVVERRGEELLVRVKDEILKEEIEIPADLVILSAAILPPEDAEEIAKLYKVPLNEDGFFLEAHVKLRPVEFATDGVFLCGLAHSPKNISETIAQAQAAAGKASILLSKKIIQSEGTVSHIDKEVCIGCRNCERTCPYGAISYNEEEEVCEVNEMLCKGCGSCAAACPSGACTLRGFEDRQILAQVEAYAR